MMLALYTVDCALDYRSNTIQLYCPRRELPLAAVRTRQNIKCHMIMHNYLEVLKTEGGPELNCASIIICFCTFFFSAHRPEVIYEKG